MSSRPFCYLAIQRRVGEKIIKAWSMLQTRRGQETNTGKSLHNTFQEHVKIC